MLKNEKYKKIYKLLSESIMKEYEKNTKKLKQIKAIVLDVDGVLTNGGLIIYPDGKFLRQMNAKDGYAIKLAIKHGLLSG